MKSLKPLTLPPVIGVESKPLNCRILCPYFSVGENFVHDSLPPNAKILLMISNPSSDDLVNRSLLTGKAGWSFFKNYIYPLGYGNDDVAISAVMRCRPRGGKFPIGQVKKGLTEACRYYDREVIAAFNPDVYIISQALRDVYSEGAFHSLMIRDFRKAFDFAAKGYKPIVLMGTEAAEMVAPYIIGQGGTKKWRGHWQEMESWPFLNASPSKDVKSGFAPARW